MQSLEQKNEKKMAHSIETTAPLIHRAASYRKKGLDVLLLSQNCQLI